MIDLSEIKELEDINDNQVHTLNAFILHQLTVHHARIQGITPQEMFTEWMGKTLSYLLSEQFEVPSPTDYKQLVELFPDSSGTLLMATFKEISTQYLEQVRQFLAANSEGSLAYNYKKLEDLSFELEAVVQDIYNISPNEIEENTHSSEED